MRRKLRPAPMPSARSAGSRSCREPLAAGSKSETSAPSWSARTEPRRAKPERHRSAARPAFVRTRLCVLYAYAVAYWVKQAW